MIRLPEELLPRQQDFIPIFDANDLLEQYHPDWQSRLIHVSKYAKPAIHTGPDSEPTSRMLPGDKPIIAYRVHPEIVIEQEPWFGDFVRGPVVDLARIALGSRYVGAGDATSSLFDFNVARPPQFPEPFEHGESHIDSAPVAALLNIACLGTYSITRFARTEHGSISEGVDIYLKPGQIAFFHGHIREHQARHLRQASLVRGRPNLHYEHPSNPSTRVRITAAVNLWEQSGPFARDPAQRKRHEGILYN